LQLLVEEAPWLQGVSLGLFVRAGVVDEPEGQGGVAHLLEHLVFRGTEKYRGDELSARIDEDGGELNAYTTKEYTCLWGRTLPQGLPGFVEMLSEIFLRPRLAARDLRREVDVIAVEHQLWLQNPEE
jgi:predicted Zn-dependent peptidase